MRWIAITLLWFLCCNNAFAANCFWVGGTASLTSSNIASWSSSSGGAGSTCAAAGGVPASPSDTATFNASSGGGTVTMNFGGTWTVGSIAMGAFTGTFTNATNNNNITVTGAAGFNGSGTGTRTITLGSATYTLSSATAAWTFSTITNLTFSGASSTIVFSGASGNMTFAGGALTYGTLTLGATTTTGWYTITDISTFATFNITAPNFVAFASGSTITNAIAWTGTSASLIGIYGTGIGSSPTITIANGSTAAWAAIRDGVFATNTLAASNSFNLGGGSGVTFAAFTGGGCILGGWLLWRDLPDHINDNFPAWLEKAA